jgi:hypothetical protein
VDVCSWLSYTAAFQENWEISTAQLLPLVDDDFRDIITWPKVHTANPSGVCHSPRLSFVSSYCFQPILKLRRLPTRPFMKGKLVRTAILFLDRLSSNFASPDAASRRHVLGINTHQFESYATGIRSVMQKSNRFRRKELVNQWVLGSGYLCIDVEILLGGFRPSEVIARGRRGK